MEVVLFILPFLAMYLVGCLVGAINSLAGGGSLITLPILMFGFGLDHQVANGTNRISILAQNVTAIFGFRSKGVSNTKFALWLAAAALPGVIIGAFSANEVNKEVFNYVLGGIMLAMMVILIYNPFKEGAVVEEINSNKRLVGAMGAFFFIGFYIGFLQAASGFLIIMALTLINRFDLVKTNSIKVVVIAIANLIALIVFIYKGNVNWTYGLVLAMGTSTGAWLGSRWSVTKGKKYIRWVLMIMIFVSALKLFGFIDWLLMQMGVLPAA